MSSEESKSSSLPRITVSLDHFDDTVINLMADKMGKSKSEIIRNILNEWIISNPDVLNSKYGIVPVDVRREIQIRNKERNVEDDLEKIVKFFKRIKSIEIDMLAEKLVMSSKTLMDLIDDYGDELEKKGLKINIERNLIHKID
jgi:DNA-directed RNA polymerase subunit L